MSCEGCSCVVFFGARHSFDVAAEVPEVPEAVPEAVPEVLPFVSVVSVVLCLLKVSGGAFLRRALHCLLGRCCRSFCGRCHGI